MHRVLILLFLCAFMQPMAVQAQEADQKIRGINQRLFKFRQEFLALKEQIENQQNLQKNQQEQFDLQSLELQKQNQDLVNQVENLQKEVQRLEQQLELNAATQLASEMADVRKVMQLVLLQTLDETEAIDDSLLEVLNSPMPVVPRDLMILFIAELMQYNEEWEQSLGYYSVLLEEFPESAYSPKAIYEMSEVFGQLDQKEEQKTLLLQLSYMEDNLYAELAKEKLEALENLSEEEAPAEETAVPSETDPPSNESLSEEEEIVAPSETESPLNSETAPANEPEPSSPTPEEN